jgi:hypothetical protein
MSKDKIILALPPPTSILLFIFEVFFSLSSSVRSGDNVGEGAGGVVWVTGVG